MLMIYRNFQLTEVHVSNDTEIVEFADSHRNYATLHAGLFVTSGLNIHQHIQVAGGSFSVGDM